jgi:hypothetical protein
MIQNKSIRIINRKSIFSSINEISTDIEPLCNRFDSQNKKYLFKAIKNRNELVVELSTDYLNLIKSRSQNHCTILCKYKEEIKNLL